MSDLQGSGETSCGPAVSPVRFYMTLFNSIPQYLQLLAVGSQGLTLAHTSKIKYLRTTVNSYLTSGWFSSLAGPERQAELQS